jgi:hypothetical protein
VASIAVDIDSTLYNFDTIAREACLKLWQETGDDKYREGVYYSSEHWRSPADTLGIDRWLRAIGLCHDDEMILQQKPFAGAVETCQGLIRAGHEVIYISNRKTETESATEEWLWAKGFLLGGTNADLVVTTQDKTPYIAHCQYLIDDRLKTCVEFVYSYDWQYGMKAAVKAVRDNGGQAEELKRRAYLLQYQYNQNATDIPGCYVAPTWAGLNVYMQRHGVLPEVAYEALT